jgi:DNA-binding NtrC family response regulator
MEKKSLLDGKRILIVDDEPDILDTLEDLLPMCRVVKASSFDEAKTGLDTQTFDMAILDIMGVDGYRLLEMATQKKVTSVMLTAYALTPQDVVKSYKKGASYYIPKEEMVNIVTFLEDILDAIAKGKNPWSRWYERLAAFCERKFGPGWKESEKEFWDRFPFY